MQASPWHLRRRRGLYNSVLPLSLSGGKTMLQSHAGSQSALAAMGGYGLPPFSTLGSHSHHWSLGMESMTMGT